MNDMSIVCVHVLEGERPILLVGRDPEGPVMACGRNDHPSIDDWALCHTVHHTDHDVALGIIRTLCSGEVATRVRVGTPWTRT